MRPPANTLQTSDLLLVPAATKTFWNSPESGLLSFVQLNIQSFCVGQAAVRVLEENGFGGHCPTQNCCGLPLLSNGEFSAARRYHLGNVRKLSEYAYQGIPIVGTSTSCTLTLKEEAPELLDIYTEEAQLVASHTYDFNEFLLLQYEAGDLNMDFHPLPLVLPYHAPCQYRAHRLGTPAVDLVGLIPELSILESEASCCGIAGTYGYKVEILHRDEGGSSCFRMFRRTSLRCL
jgi:glycerol-3-phosphate dehydrogenase subunit C